MSPPGLAFHFEAGLGSGWTKSNPLLQMFRQSLYSSLWSARTLLSCRRGAVE